MHQWVSTNSSLKINCAGKHIDSEALLGTVDEPEAYFRWEHIEKKTDLAIYLNQRTSIKHASLVKRWKRTILPVSKPVRDSITTTCIVSLQLGIYCDR